MYPGVFFKNKIRVRTPGVTSEFKSSGHWSQKKHGGRRHIEANFGGVACRRRKK